MRLRVHLASGILAAAVLAPRLRWRALALGCGAALADLDLVAYYAVRHRRLAPRAAMRYYQSFHGRREHARKVLHLPLAPVLALAAGRRVPGLGAFGAGLILHQAFDRGSARRYERLRRALHARSGARCEMCGQPQDTPALMEPQYRGAGAVADRDPAHWLLVCRPCNERHHRAIGQL